MAKCRCKGCVKFRKKYPFEFLDIYGLYYTIAQYLVPRLKAFKKHNFSFPVYLTSKEWDKILDKMIKAFELINSDDIGTEDYANIDKGIKLFAEYYRDLYI